MKTLGVDSWEGKCYHKEGESYQSAEELLMNVNWARVIQLASEKRDNIPCKLSEAFHAGTDNLVRHLTFADGVQWVIALKWPIDPNDPTNVDEQDMKASMESEAAVTKLIRQTVSIQVPQIHGFDPREDNEVGTPYMFMDYIHGTQADRLRGETDCGYVLIGTPEQDIVFRKQMASIQVQLASVQFDQIGAVYVRQGRFVIGPEPETNKGPWSSPAEYYTDLSDHIMKKARERATPQDLERPSFSYLTAFPKMMQQYGQGNDQRSFGLVNHNLGIRNFLVNEKFEIIGMTDLANIMAAPIEVAAQLPSFSMLQLPTPGRVETRPNAVRREKAEAPKIAEYVELIREAATQQGAPENVKGMADMMTSDAASVLQSLRYYMPHDKKDQDAWAEAYMYLSMRGSG